jgi:hypothetical protein
MPTATDLRRLAEELDRAGQASTRSGLLIGASEAGATNDENEDEEDGDEVAVEDDSVADVNDDEGDETLSQLYDDLKTTRERRTMTAIAKKIANLERQRSSD